MTENQHQAMCSKFLGTQSAGHHENRQRLAYRRTEAEYVALYKAICEAKWIRKLLIELGIDCEDPVPIFEDNQACIKTAEEPREYKRMKHIDIKYNFIRKTIANGECKLEYKPTSEQVADIMTKGLGRNLYEAS